MKILGIDQSLTSTGWVVLEDNTVTSHGIISTPKDNNKFDRMASASYELVAIADDNKPLDAVVIEGLPFGMSHSNVSRDLAGLQAVIVTALHAYGFELDEDLFIIAPTTLKKHATGSGKASKQEMFDALPLKEQGLFGSVPKTKGRFDLTDAYWLAHTGAKSLT